MTASAPAARRTALAARLSREMERAEQQGFGTSTVWLTREETDLICAALAQDPAPSATRRGWTSSTAVRPRWVHGTERSAAGSW
ncbi:MULTISPECIES: hypothetical protein [unclassified Methylobacterium]|uniref:hypothetical protein n=1 Tax=unclassified Methylobacterium TaxID=2615210 RepID=UPI0036FE4663